MSDELPEATQPRRSLGYRPDPEDPRDFASEQLLGAPVRADAIIPASMMDHVVGTMDQREASSCVSFALVRAIDMSLRAAAADAGASAEEIPHGSPGFIYFNARQRENVEKQTREPLEDGGSYPRLAMKSVQALGYCPDVAYPYEEALARINSPPPPSAYGQAFDMRGMLYARVYAIGRSRVAEVARALAQGKPVIFGAQIDEAFAGNRGDRITSIDTTKLLGGHMMTVGAVDLDDVTIVNSWGAGWGQLGIGRMSHELFGGSLISDVYIIHTAPAFSKEVA